MNCDVTDTRIAEEAKRTYTYTDMSATKHTKKRVKSAVMFAQTANAPSLIT